MKLKRSPKYGNWLTLSRVREPGMKCILLVIDGKFVKYFTYLRKFGYYHKRKRAYCNFEQIRSRRRYPQVWRKLHAAHRAFRSR